MSEAAQTLTVVIPLRVKPRGGRKAMVTPGVLALERRQDITLIKAVARAFRWRRMLEIRALRARSAVSEDFGPFSPALDVQAFSRFAQHHGMSSSMRLFGQPLTRRVSRSVK